jgi:hypothetical protein
MLFGLSAPAFATPGQIHEVKRPEVNLRAAPGTDAKVIGSLEEGARLMEFGRKGRWFKVKEMGRVGPEGWVHGALIAPEALPEPAAAAPPQRPADESKPDDYSNGGDGPVYYDPPLGRYRDRLRDRAFVPWGVTVKRKGRRHKGKGHHGHGDRAGKGDAKAQTRPPPARNLGSPRRSGAPNLGTF